jgi:hypothetical protein
LRPRSPARVLIETSIPATNAHAAVTRIAAQWYSPVIDPVNTATAPRKLQASIRRARCAYGSSPSENETFNAPVVTATAPRGSPIAIPIPSGSATPIAFRNAIQLLILCFSSRVMIRQKAVLGRGCGVSANVEYKTYFTCER